ncbi:unnamed protein product, partial [Larinioides sclopetarius]
MHTKSLSALQNFFFEEYPSSSFFSSCWESQDWLGKWKTTIAVE